MPNVSRETMATLDAYAALLVKWNERINLVSKSTIQDLWQRHFLDSAQLCQFIKYPNSTIIDFGSGAGFPALVVSIITGARANLIESDQRKCAFLQQVIQATGANAVIHSKRIEDIKLPAADFITARAMADLSALLAHATKFWGKDTRCLFLKGKAAANELTMAAETWFFDHEAIESQTDASGHILIISNLKAKA